MLDIVIGLSPPVQIRLDLIAIKAMEIKIVCNNMPSDSGANQFIFSHLCKIYKKHTPLNPASLKNLSERDKKYIWHPLTQHKRNPEHLPISRASGALLYDEEGKSYIDGIASWYTCMYGHCNPYILERVGRQMQQLDQVVFSGFTHEPAVQLAEALVGILPFGQQKIFFSDNGSTSVEVAVKMALQYHANLGNKRSTLLAFENGFHGDTFGAMSVSGLSVYNGPFEEYFLNVERIPVPDNENIGNLLALLETRAIQGDIAAFIYEPLVQGAAGMKMYSAEGLDSILALMHTHGILTIADEVMTGFGKTGAYFASDHLQTKPDIVCLSKALTAGLMPMAATSCTNSVYNAFYSDDLSKGLFHGHTYTANPLACTAALAGIELLRTAKTQEQIRQVAAAHSTFASEIMAHPRVRTTRHCGVIFALDMDMPLERYGPIRDELYRHFMNNGIFLRPLGNTLYILPPYCITSDQLKQVYNSIRTALNIV
jgi:adenosylmethionine-8-amino-7-oxononanoate aminotransferase